MIIVHERNEVEDDDQNRATLKLFYDIQFTREYMVIFCHQC